MCCSPWRRPSLGASRNQQPGVGRRGHGLRGAHQCPLDRRRYRRLRRRSRVIDVEWRACREASLRRRVTPTGVSLFPGRILRLRRSMSVSPVRGGSPIVFKNLETNVKIAGHHPKVDVDTQIYLYFEGKPCLCSKRFGWVVVTKPRDPIIRQWGRWRPSPTIISNRAIQLPLGNEGVSETSLTGPPN